MRQILFICLLLCVILPAIAKSKRKIGQIDPLWRFHQRLKPKQRELLIDTFKACVDALEVAKGFQWFLDGSSLLGYHRHNGSLIPWHDEIEIGIVNYEKKMTMQRLTGFEAGFNAIFQNYQSKYGRLYFAMADELSMSIKVFAEDKRLTRPIGMPKRDVSEKKLYVAKARWPSVNLIFYEISSAMIRRPRPLFQYAVATLFPLKEVEFESTKVYAPQDIGHYLGKLYGDLKICNAKGFDSKRNVTTFPWTDEYSSKEKLSIQCSELGIEWKQTKRSTASSIVNSLER